MKDAEPIVTKRVMRIEPAIQAQNAIISHVLEATRFGHEGTAQLTHVFAYGTLKDRRVQRQVLGRAVSGRPDVLPGWTKAAVRFDDTLYPNIEPSAAAVVEGVVLDVDDVELRLIDDYEGVEYVRRMMGLQSKAIAWVYYAVLD